MPYKPENPLIVQGDHTILMEVDSPRYADARDALARFAELVKSPEHIHTYRITSLSIWNACAAGMSPEQIAQTLTEFAKYDVPKHVEAQIADFASRFGRLQLTRDEASLLLVADEPALSVEIERSREVAPFILERESPVALRVDPLHRGRIKQALVQVGFPTEDLAGYTPGEPLELRLREVTMGGSPFNLRRYQEEAAAVFHASGAVHGGSGVIVLPCGAGKTVVGLACMAQEQTSTLILTTNVTSSRQWIRETLDKTTLAADQVGEYNGQSKDVRPVTVATYNILTWRKNKESGFPHLTLFDERNWGLIIYDEVHLLPAPVFQVTAGLQARRRLGLTATLVREDGKEEDVFALIGPKKADVPWKVLEKQGWIASAVCSEIRLPLPESLKMTYAVAEARDKFRIASENALKQNAARQVLEKHAGEPTLIIGMYVDQLRLLADELKVPLIVGSTSQKKRDALFADFRSGKLPVLAVSKVGNFAIDLPDASVAIQISGTFGSRQEEAQRLGRILRPKAGANQAHFYTIVTRDTVEQDFALQRQLFLCEQGYAYEILDGDERGSWKDPSANHSPEAAGVSTAQVA